MTEEAFLDGQDMASTFQTALCRASPSRRVLGEPRRTAEDQVIIWTYKGGSCAVTPHVHLGAWGELLL